MNASPRCARLRARPHDRPCNVRVRVSAVVALFALITSSCRARQTADAGMVSAWVRALYGAIRVERLSPPVASRVAAYAMTGLHAGLVAAHPELAALDGTMNALPSLPRAVTSGAVNDVVVAVAAERTVLDALLAEALPTTRAALHQLADSLIAREVERGATASVTSRSDSLGVRVGEAIVAWSRSDGFAATRGRPYAPPIGEALWVNDAPGTIYATQNLSAVSEFVSLDNPANVARAGNTSDRGLILSRPKSAAAKTLPAANMAGATEPYWREVRPFVLETWNACPVDQPPVYATDTSSIMYHNARAVFNTKVALTDEQRTIGYYWADNAGDTGTPVGHWLSIASQMISEHQLDAITASRLVTATAVAQADAFIAAWGYKYQYNVLRPRTYIRRVIDPQWEPLIPTPPFPEHPAGHSTQSAAAAQVLTAFIGVTPFADSTSISIGHGVRTFPSFQAASEEAGMSRVYGGIHYPSGNTSGLALGRCIGAKVAAAFRAARVTRR